MKKTKKLLLLMIITFVITTLSLSSCSENKKIYYIDNIEEYDIEDLENLTDYTLPNDTVIVALNMGYKGNNFVGGYLHLKIPEDSIQEFIDNFPEDKKLMTIPSDMNNLIEWSGLNRDELQIYAVYEERYLSIKYTSINSGDKILILQPIDNYYDVYIAKEISDERPTTKAWGKGEKIKGKEGMVK